MLISISIRPPAAVANNGGMYDVHGQGSMSGACKSEGESPDRYIIQYCYNEMWLILQSLKDLECSFRIRCEVKEGKFFATGRIELWSERPQQIVAHALEKLAEHGARAASACRESQAWIDAMHLKVATRRIA